MSFIAEDARDWTPGELCQALADMYYALAGRTDALAVATHPMHAAIDAALNVAIVTAYPQETAAWGAGTFINTVRNLFVDTRDPIDQCVNRAVLDLTHARRTAAERYIDASRHGGTPGAPMVGVPAVGRVAPHAPATDPWHHALPIAPMPITCGAALTPYLGARPSGLRCANAIPCPDHPMETKALSGIALAVSQLPIQRDPDAEALTVAMDNRRAYADEQDRYGATSDRRKREAHLANMSALDDALTESGFTTCRHGMSTGARCGDLSVRGTDRCPSHPVTAITEPGE